MLLPIAQESHYQPMVHGDFEALGLDAIGLRHCVPASWRNHVRSEQTIASTLDVCTAAAHEI